MPSIRSPKPSQQARKPDPDKKTILDHLTTAKTLSKECSGKWTRYCPGCRHPDRSKALLMTQFDQRYQQVETQYNAEHDINVQQPLLSLTEKQRKRNRSKDARTGSLHMD